jgi:flagellum-specific ATP synthase
MPTATAANPHLQSWLATLTQARVDVNRTAATVTHSGRLTRAVGLVLEAVGLQLPVGSDCLIELPPGYPQRHAEAEVVGFAGDRLFLMPQTEVAGLLPGARVFSRPGTADGGGDTHTKRLPVGEGMLGRVVDAVGRPLDGLGPLDIARKVPLSAPPINPLTRAPIDSVLDTGVRAINAMLTVGRGQRMGLFAGSGVGKSVLLGMMARYTSAEVIVVGSPLLRLQGAAYATCLAEYFRDRGKDVLLIMDSLTRYAMAQREIALAVGEPPATKGYPPSVFAKLPALVERAGNGARDAQGRGGSITAFYTVLSEGDDQQDPIADSARAILDGHVVLSRQLAESGHYPAIDIEASISRAMTALIPPAQFDTVRRFKQMLSRYQRNRDLISVGAYAAGHDLQLDQAIALYPKLEAFLQQGMEERTDYAASVARMAGVFA